MERQICLPKYSLLLFSIYKANAQIKLIFNPFPLPDDSPNIQPKEKKGSLYIFSFRCSFCFYCPLG